jgi:hypothetical protein
MKVQIFLRDNKKIIKILTKMITTLKNDLTIIQASNRIHLLESKLHQGSAKIMANFKTYIITNLKALPSKVL